MFYFAHGSNIDRPQMQVRCPAAQYVAVAKANGYRLCFPRWSRVRASAVASIEAAKGETVWGVLYEIDQGGLDRLDIAEGLLPLRDPALNTCRRLVLEVERPDGRAVEAVTHVAIPAADPGKPSASYLLVLVRAAVALGLPEEFIARLKAVEPQPLAA